MLELSYVNNIGTTLRSFRLSAIFIGVLPGAGVGRLFSRCRPMSKEIKLKFSEKRSECIVLVEAISAGYCVSNEAA